MPPLINISDEEFTMKESKIAGLAIGGFFLILFVLVLFNLLTNERLRNNSSDKKLLYGVLVVAAIAGTTSTISGLKHKTILTINKNGIFSMGELKTNWENFINAKSIEESSDDSSTSFAIIKYYKNDGIYESEIRILDTYDKSSEEVIEAIKKFNPYSGDES